MMMMARPWWVLGAMLMGSACTTETPRVVGSNCDNPADCRTQAALHLDAVDILMVIDNSNSIVPVADELKAQLPRLLSAIVTGSDGSSSFPPANSVHIAVTTSDMGVGDAASERIPSCTKTGGDGVFVRPGEVGVTCDVSYPGYLAFEGGPAALSTVSSVACVPLVFNVDGANGGCGFEQPLEAALKSVWPAANPAVTFVSGVGHGSEDNQGFLRDNSLLVVVIVTDEDDCSATDQSIFDLMDPERGDINLRCFHNKDKLQDPARYVEHFRSLRPHNDNVVFAVIGGVPAELVSDDYRSHYDFAVPAQVDAYLDDVLADEHMQERVDPQSMEGSGTGNLLPSCITPPRTPSLANPASHLSFPPRRLLEVARGFGPQAVIGSICASEFGTTTGHIIRAVGERLNAATTH
jgi:hypothetical protein